MAIARTSPVDPPSAEQLAGERSARFHQDGNALLTLESVRAWIAATGLALYLPRPDQLAAPTPSFVEAILGTSTPEPTQNQLQQASGMLTRLIAEGSCVPLNLLGATSGSGTDTPDYVCSPVVFSFLFTMRGNKAWKTAPVTSGPVKVSPLALNTYEMLAEKVTMSSYDLTTQLGKEVTEAAVLRALTELWQQLRVLPIPQADGSATLWELSTSRFTKQIKAGANAGQPTALSALISLYLNQVIAATEDDVETFLSPLAPRSRLRSVMHDLIGARQLETIVVNGKTLLHVAGDLPSFAGTKNAKQAVPDTQEAENPAGETGLSKAAEGGRIRKFIPDSAARLATGMRVRPAFGNKPGFAKKPGFGQKPTFGRPSGDRERPAFNKPWNDERSRNRGVEGTPGSAGEIAGSAEETSASPAFRPQRPFGTKPTFGSRSGSVRAAFRDNPAYRDRPERSRIDSGSGDALPPRAGGFGARPLRPFAEKSAFSPRGGAEQRRDASRPFSKPNTFGRTREGGFDRNESRPPRREFGDGEDRPPRTNFSSGDTRPPRREFNAGESRPPRREFSSDRRAGTDFKRPGSFSGPRSERNPGRSLDGFSGPRPEQSGAFPSRKPYTPREGNDRPSFRERPAFGQKPGFGSKPRNGQSADFSRPKSTGAAGDAPSKTFRKFDAPRGPKPFGAKPFDDRKSFERPRSSSTRTNDARSSFAAKGGPFAKFADGKKPFRKPGKPSDGGGLTPTRRKRPSDEV